MIDIYEGGTILKIPWDLTSFSGNKKDSEPQLYICVAKYIILADANVLSQKYWELWSAHHLFSRIFP